jgi:hypothetical protein
MTTGSRAVACWLLVLLAACAGAPRATTAPVPVPRPDDVETAVFLIGDAGAPAPGGEPVLRALSRDLAGTAAPSVVVFLGDNIYPRGLPPAAAPDRPTAERRLQAQLDVVLRGRGVGILVPGNHDWAEEGDDGWDAVRRQGAFVDSAGRGRVAMLPGDGCPGPAVRDIGTRLRIVALDTQWWLHAGPRPDSANSTCVPRGERGVIDSLRAVVDGAGDRGVVVVAHHPLRSGGPHGGRFGWKGHVFPLREWRSWFWLPLPILGSVYPAARRSGASPQDIPDPRNQRMRDALRQGFAARPPLLYASGHDHSLQVLEGGGDDGPRHLVVSGGGIYGHASHAARLRETRFVAPGRAGYVRLDALRYGPIRLGVITVDARGTATERYSAYLD